MRVFYPSEPGGTEMTFMELPDTLSNEEISDLIEAEYKLKEWENREKN